MTLEFVDALLARGKLLEGASQLEAARAGD